MRNTILQFHYLAEVDHRTVDVNSSVLFVPLDAVEVSASLFVDSAPQGHVATGTCLDLITQTSTCRSRTRCQEN